MAFSDLLQQDGVGHVWLLDISTDNFATVSYRWATGSVVDGSGNRYEAKIKPGTYSRSFGSDNFPVASTIEIEVDNTDFGADWLVDRSTFATSVLKARFRLRLALYDPTAAYTAHPSLTIQTMGDFVCLDFPSRDATTVKLSLADDTLGRIADLSLAPSINEWIADGDTTASNCPFVGTTPARLGNWDQPIQLAFGHGQIKCPVMHSGYRKQPTNGQYHPIIVCATTNTSSSADTAVNLKGQFREDFTIGGDDWRGQTVGIPPTWVDSTGTSQTIWSMQKTDSISKDSKTWRICWIRFDIVQYKAWFNSTYGENQGFIDNVAPKLVDPSQGNAGYGAQGQGGDFEWAAFDCFWFQGYPLSARTVTSSWYQYGPDIVRDLISYYSGASSSDVDSTSFDAVKAAMGPYFCGGVVQPFSASEQLRPGFAGADPRAAYGVNKLREALGQILASIDCDLYLSWTGTYKLIANNVSFADFTATYESIDESRMQGVSERTPSLGERWTPFNRVYVESPQGETLGPFDHPSTVTTWGKIFPRTLSAKWVLDSGYTGFWSFVWQRRMIESVHRPLLRFVTDMGALRFDLGTFVYLTWTRLQGGSTPYSSSLFRIEKLAIDPKSMSVLVEAIWMADLLTDLPYLLDDETLVTISSGSGGRTLSVANGDPNPVASSGSFISDGVEAGDMLIVRDTVEGATGFTNNRAVIITSVDSATQLTVDSYVDWTDRTGITNWSIVKGATTYPTSSDDPTNYPSGGTMYGKVSGETDLFSDSSSANKLKDG